MDLDCKSILDSMPQGCQIIGFDWRYRYVNILAEKHIGRPKAEVLGLSVMECWPGRTGTRVFDLVKSCLEERTTHHLDNEVTYPDGHRGWYGLTIQPVTEGIAIFSVDITKRKQAEAALRESEERYRLAAQGAKVGTYTYDFQSGVGNWSAELKALWGVEPDATVVLDADSLFSGLHADDRSTFLAAMTAANDPSGDGLLDLDYRIVRPDGSVRWLHVHGQTDFVGEEKSRRPRRAAGAAFDITERKQTEEALLQSERALKEAQRVARMGNWSWDADSDEVWWSEELYRLFEKAPDSPPPSFKDAHQNYTPESVARLTAVVQKAWQTGVPYVVDLERRISNGPRRWVQARGEAVRNASGQIVGLRGTAQDITDLKAAQESTRSYAKRLVTLEEDLRKGIATELHDDVGQEITALSLNLGFISQLLGRDIEGVIRSSLDESLDLTKAINRTVRGLMNALRPTQLDEYGLVSALRTYVDQFAKRTGIAATIEASPGFPRLSSKKEVALFRITQESLNNIVKHAEATEVTVVLDSDTTATRLTITDNGKGLPPGSAYRSPGSGYGLTIMRERAALVDGQFRISSAPGEGTSVVIELGEGD